MPQNAVPPNRGAVRLAALSLVSALSLFGCGAHVLVEPGCELPLESCGLVDDDSLDLCDDVSPGSQAVVAKRGCGNYPPTGVHRGTCGEQKGELWCVDPQ
jgi:hypothetical protein